MGGRAAGLMKLLVMLRTPRPGYALSLSLTSGEVNGFARSRQCREVAPAPEIASRELAEFHLGGGVKSALIFQASLGSERVCSRPPGQRIHSPTGSPAQPST